MVLAGMGGVARSELVAAVSTAGGFGFLGMVREPPELIRREINRVRAATTLSFRRQSHTSRHAGRSSRSRNRHSHRGAGRRSDAVLGPSAGYRAPAERFRMLDPLPGRFRAGSRGGRRRRGGHRDRSRRRSRWSRTWDIASCRPGPRSRDAPRRSGVGGRRHRGRQRTRRRSSLGRAGRRDRHGLPGDARIVCARLSQDTHRRVQSPAIPSTPTPFTSTGRKEPRCGSCRTA